jgi:hypothetical protein
VSSPVDLNSPRSRTREACALPSIQDDSKAESRALKRENKISVEKMNRL